MRAVDSEDAERAVQISDRYQGNITVLLTDLSLPKGSGQAVAKSLLRKRSGLKVLYMSAHPNEVVRGVREASTDFLQKPFTQDALAQKLRNLLDRAA